MPLILENAEMSGELVRLSSWVFFVDHGERVEVHHTISGSGWKTTHATARRLAEYAGFHLLVPDMVLWVERGVLVLPFRDPLVAPRDAAAEGRLGTLWNDWYWEREVEAERDYSWLGEVVLKMPDDLFMYQELMHDHSVRRVLEIGYGRGGGLWFFASILALRGGGHVVGVENEPPDQVPDFQRYPTVRVDCIHRDAHLSATVAEVANLATAFDLIVIDADPAPDGKLALLERWTPLLSSKGVIVVEDLCSPDCVANGGDVSRGLDQFLLEHADFGIRIKARRFATGKANRAVFQRVQPERSGYGREDMTDSRVETSQPNPPSQGGPLVSRSVGADLAELVWAIRKALDEEGFYYCPTFSIDPSGNLLLDLAHALGSIYVPPDEDPARPFITTQPDANAPYHAPFNRAEGIGWHNDFSTHTARPEVSLASMIHTDPSGPLGGAWRVASCKRLVTYLQGTPEGQRTLEQLATRDLPFSFTSEDPPAFFRVLEALPTDGPRFGLRFYGRALRNGAAQAFGTILEDIERMIRSVEDAADHVGRVIAAPAGALLVTDNRRALHDRLPQSVKGPYQRRTSLLCFIDRMHSSTRLAPIARRWEPE